MKKNKDPLPPFELSPFDVDRFLLGRLNDRSKQNGAFLAALVAPVVALALIVVAATTNALTVSDWPGIVIDDWKTLGGAETGQSSSDFPLARDSVSLLVSLLQGANLWLLFRQWQAMTDFCKELEQAGSIKAKKGNNPAKQFSDANTFFESFGSLAPLTLLLSAIAAAVLYVNFGSESIFAAFAPSDLDEGGIAGWSQGAYDAWWASPKNLPGMIAFIAVSTFIVYYILLQNVVGLRLSKLVWDVRKQFTYEGDSLNTDGHFGWEPAARVLKTVYQSLSINSACMAMVYYLFNGQKPGGLWPFTFLLIGAGSIYIFVPIWVIRSGLSKFRKDQANKLARSVPKFTVTPGPAEDAIARKAEWLVMRAATRDEIRAIRTLNFYPWKGRVIALLGFNLVVFSAAVAQVLQYVFTT